MSPEQAEFPAKEQLRQAIDLYLERAYPEGPPPEMLERFAVPEGIPLEEWLMREQIERSPDGELDAVRSFALRLGNYQYPHMKLRLSRPPKDGVFLFSVDAHDACLKAPPGSPDAGPLEQLKRSNAEIAAAILAAWDAADLPTERWYLREKIRKMRET